MEDIGTSENTGIQISLQCAWHPNLHYFIQMLRKKRQIIVCCNYLGFLSFVRYYNQVKPFETTKTKTKQPSLFVQA